jgi:hypothetical protein
VVCVVDVPVDDVPVDDVGAGVGAEVGPTQGALRTYTFAPPW